MGELDLPSLFGQAEWREDPPLYIRPSRMEERASFLYSAYMNGGVPLSSIQSNWAEEEDLPPVVRLS